MRASLTACAVPSCWAQSWTRYFSSIRRAGPRCDGRERRELVEVRRLEIADAVRQCAIGGDGPVQPAAKASHSHRHRQRRLHQADLAEITALTLCTISG
ncbi:MAG TPA: hypothetical protein VFW65_32320 [Pseudonocardiaceae bacterium]|nr:hypothetical protein [Pseudonocardiaceae bacterium]